MRKFDKPEKNNQELIEEWERRGLEIPDRQRAERYLEFISCLPILSRFKKLVSILLNRIHRLTIFSCCMYLTEN